MSFYVNNPTSMTGFMPDLRTFAIIQMCYLPLWAWQANQRWMTASCIRLRSQENNSIKGQMVYL